MAQVIKIKYENTLRRIIIQKDFSFTQLETHIREVFQIPGIAQLSVTYTDEEDDVVTMANDQDVRDAIDNQSLNPLRLHVTLVTSKSSPDSISLPVVEKFAGATDGADVPLKVLLKKLSLTAPETFKHMMQPFEPLFVGVTSPAQIPTLVEDLVQTISSQIASAVKNGVAAAATSHPLAATISTQPKTPIDTSCPAAVGALSCGSANVFGVAPRTGIEKNEGVRSENTVHYGITCDICSISPIAGLRWKSNKKYDYDLCTSCFEKHGNVDDYIKVEQPVYRPRHCYGSHGMIRMAGKPAMGSSFCGPTGRHSFGGRNLARGPFGPCGEGRHYFSPMRGAVGGKLDSRFVSDVTIFDGTEIAPGANFTKIWRLRNSGSFPWPAHTSLVHIAGDELGHHVATVPLEIVEPGEEIDVSVDLVAPEKPGRYVSQWRLASPGGPKFGHRIWVIIQVIPNAPLDQPASVESDISRNEEQKLETDAGEICDQPASVEDNLSRGEEQKSAPNSTVTAGLTEEFTSKGEMTKQLEPALSFVKVDVPFDIVEDGATVATEAEIIEVEGKVGDGDLGGEFSMVDVAVRHEESLKEVEKPITYPVVEAGTTKDPSPAVEGELSTLEVLLAKLNAMGFTDTKLNMELLENNNLDLRTTLDDLCAAEEWDPILEELEEMGFYDTDMNRRLMFKNKGSVKRVVKELVHMSRDFDGKGKKVMNE